MAPIRVKIWENAFQTIPDISFFDAENNKQVQTLNGRLPLEHGSDRRETLGKRVSDDSRHFIFRRPKIFFGAADDAGAADVDRPKTAENGSDRRETLGKRVSDDSQHFIFRRRKIVLTICSSNFSDVRSRTRCFGGAMNF